MARTGHLPSGPVLLDRPIDLHLATTDDGVRIAYQVVGDGPVDVVYVPGYISNLELIWEDPAYVRFLDGLASFSRLIVMDKRGTGLSDRTPGRRTVEDYVRDIRAVVDAAGGQRVALVGGHDGAAAALLFAAAEPDRVSSVVAYCCRARCMVDDDYPLGWPPRLVERWLERTLAQWGRVTSSLEDPSQLGWSPSRADDHLLFWNVGRFQRLSAGPEESYAVMRMYADLDIRGVLHSVRTPVLVLNRDNDPTREVEHGRYLAERLPNAELRTVPGDELPIWWGDVGRLVGEIRTFLTGSGEGATGDRALATVLFTDVVGSTERAVEVGDRRWRELLDRHDEHVRTVVARFNGRIVKTTGDGILATFDGPARAIRCGRAITDTVANLGLQVRTGIHTGEVEVRGDDVAGIAVVLANRVMSTAGASEIVVSRTVKDLVAGSGIEFRDRGSHRLKGIPDEWQLYEVAAT